MNALNKALGAFVPVIMFLNLAGSIVGSIWALVTGDWWAVGYVILGVIASNFAISIALMPSLAIGAAGMARCSVATSLLVGSRSS